MHNNISCCFFLLLLIFFCILSLGILNEQRCEKQLKHWTDRQTIRIVLVVVVVLVDFRVLSKATSCCLKFSLMLKTEEKLFLTMLYTEVLPQGLSFLFKFYTLIILEKYTYIFRLHTYILID